MKNSIRSYRRGEKLNNDQEEVKMGQGYQGTLFEQINELITMERELGFNEVAQVFGAEVDDDGKVENGGMRGFRVISNTTALDSQGTDENEPQMSNRELFKSAWKELQKSMPAINQREAAAFARKQAFREKEMELVRKGFGVTDPEELEDINDEIEEFRALNKGFLADLTDKELHPYFCERELDASSPELMGYQFEREGFSRLFDEANKEFISFKKISLGERNWDYLKGMEQKRIARFEWLKVKIRETFEDALRLKRLGYTIIFNEKMREFNVLKFKIHEARDYSFAWKLLNSMTPTNVSSKPWWQKRNFYLKLDLQKKLRASKVKFDINKHLNKKDRLIHKVYSESRGLTGDYFENGKKIMGQHSILLDGWTKMLAVLKK